MISYKRPIIISFLLATSLVGAVGTWIATKKNDEQPASGPALISLEKMGQLVSVKLNYSNVIEFLQPRTLDVKGTPWEVRLGGTKVLLVAKGDCTVAADLRYARYENIDVKSQTLTIALPTPAPLQARINHDDRAKGGSYFYTITEHGLQTMLPGLQNSTSAVNGALRRAQNEVEQACKQPEVLSMAKMNAEAVLSGMFLATGWRAKFVWK